MLERAHSLTSRFELLQQLGAGSEGQRWLPGDRVGGRRVALKLTQVQLRGGRGIDLEREFELLQRLRLPNVIRAFGVHRSVHQDELHIALALEYGSCGYVSSLRAGPMREVLEIVAPIAPALGFVH